jgi:cytochrome c peroxidase
VSHLRRRALRLLLAVISALLCCRSRSFAVTPYQWTLPPGFPQPSVPDDNPMSVEKVALGRFLFYDTRMSGNETYSCGSCHKQELAFTDGFEQAIGSTGQLHPRSSMSLTNVAYNATFAWANPLLTQLEKQALIPMFGDTPLELGLSGKDELLDRIKADARYQRLFAEAYPDDTDPITLDNLVKALASFVRTLISGNAPYDRYINGLDDNAISLSAYNGGRLFFSERLECFHCHGGYNFVDSETHDGKLTPEIQFHNNGLYNIGGTGAYPPDNTGIFAFTQVATDMGSFKAPTLRNIELTAPYMHDGSIATLEGVLIDHYGRGGRLISDGPYAGDGSTNPFKSGFIRGFTLTDQEKEDVLNFLKSLTDTDFVTNPHFSDPFTGQFCSGDCDLDGAVTVNELITAIDVSFDSAPLADCVTVDSNGDGTVAINELVAAVQAALNGCGSSHE